MEVLAGLAGSVLDVLHKVGEFGHVDYVQCRRIDSENGGEEQHERRELQQQGRECHVEDADLEEHVTFSII